MLDASRHRGQHHGRARNAERRIEFQPLQKILGGHPQMRPRLLHELLTLAPSQHQRSHGHGNQEWEPATSNSLVVFAAKNTRSTRSRAPFSR